MTAANMSRGWKCQSARLHPDVRESIPTVLGVVSTSDAAYRSLLTSYSAKVAIRPRVGIVGGQQYPKGHDVLSKAYELGRRLKLLGRDIVVIGDGAGSVAHWAVKGHQSVKKEGCTYTWLRRTNSVRGGDHLPALEQLLEVAPPADIFSALATSLVAFPLGPAELVTVLDWLQKSQFVGKIGHQTIAPGLRPAGRWVDFGLRPPIHCMEAGLDWLFTMVQTFARQNTISAERGEHELIDFPRNIDDLLNRLTREAALFETAVKEHGPIDLPGSKNELLAQARSAWLTTSSHMNSLGPLFSRYYGMAAFGSHSLKPEDPHMHLSDKVGTGLARMRVGLIEGNGAEHSIMGRVARAYMETLSQYKLDGFSLGNSIDLGWEKCTTTRSATWRLPVLHWRLVLFAMVAKDLTVFRGGFGTAYELAVFLQNAHRLAKVRKGLGAFPLGLDERVVKMGWSPMAFCFENRAKTDCDWLHEFVAAMAKNRFLDPMGVTATFFRFGTSVQSWKAFAEERLELFEKLSNRVD